MPGIFLTGLMETGLAGAIGTGIVFVEAGLAKLRHRDVLPGVVANYRLLPEGMVAPVATLLPLVELGLGLGLLASSLTGSGPLHWLALPAAALFLVFATAMAINIRRGRSQIDCGCGRSQLRQPLGWGLVIRNCGLALLVAMYGIVPPTGFVAGNVALALVAGLCLFLFFLLYNALTALAASPLASGRR
ncbi:MauE/DoxX family redox-associated membrane protein [Novosphingobium sp.]|uniref:MauE/DoxX family redox-associated membrane protein n=1 Tax=Novosphingobium sp. TaxID=1874826 RepID=UPI003B525B33